MSGYRGYVELVRPANVATALADVLAGYAVAGMGDSRHSPSLLAWLLLSTTAIISLPSIRRLRREPLGAVAAVESGSAAS